MAAFGALVVVTLAQYVKFIRKYGGTRYTESWHDGPEYLEVAQICVMLAAMLLWLLLACFVVMLMGGRTLLSVASSSPSAIVLRLRRWLRGTMIYMSALIAATALWAAKATVVLNNSVNLSDRTDRYDESVGERTGTVAAVLGGILAISYLVGFLIFPRRMIRENPEPRRDWQLQANESVEPAVRDVDIAGPEPGPARRTKDHLEGAHQSPGAMDSMNDAMLQGANRDVCNASRNRCSNWCLINEGCKLRC
jgi:hypothetical protein